MVLLAVTIPFSATVNMHKISPIEAKFNIEVVYKPLVVHVMENKNHRILLIKLVIA